MFPNANLHKQHLPFRDWRLVVFSIPIIGKGYVWINTSELQFHLIFGMRQSQTNKVRRWRRWKFTLQQNIVWKAPNFFQCNERRLPTVCYTVVSAAYKTQNNYSKSYDLNTPNGTIIALAPVSLLMP